MNDKLKDVIKFGSEEPETLYIGIVILQNLDFSINVDQNAYINSISEITLTAEQQKEQNSPLKEEEKTLYHSATGQLDWVAGITTPDICFAVCEASTKLKHTTVCEQNH